MQSKASREAVVSFIVTFFYCVSTHEQECLRSESQWTNGMNVCVCVWPRCGFERRSLRRDLLVKIPIDTNFRLFSKFSSLKWACEYRELLLYISITCLFHRFSNYSDKSILRANEDSKTCDFYYETEQQDQNIHLRLLEWNVEYLPFNTLTFRLLHSLLLQAVINKNV